MGTRRGGASHEQICDSGLLGMWYSRVPRNHHDLHHLPGWRYMYVLESPASRWGLDKWGVSQKGHKFHAFCTMLVYVRTRCCILPAMLNIVSYLVTCCPCPTFLLESSLGGFVALATTLFVLIPSGSYNMIIIMMLMVLIAVVVVVVLLLLIIIIIMIIIIIIINGGARGHVLGGGPQEGPPSVIRLNLGQI